MSAPTDLAIEVRGLGKVYEPAPRWLRAFLRTQVSEPVRALDAVDLHLEQGTVLVVAGPNGAGKSTLFRILAGLVAPTTGVATVLGQDATAQSVDLRRNLGFVSGDDRSLWLRHTVMENLEFRARLQGLRRTEMRRRIDTVLERVELGHASTRVCFALSAGMRARLQLACALLHSPPVLVLDEPTGAIDPVGSYRLLELVQHLAHDDGTSVLISTHKVEEIEALGDRVALLHAGRVVHFGPLDSLYARTHQARRLQLRFESDHAASCGAAALSAVWGVEELAVDRRHVTLATGLTTGRLLAVLDGELSAIECLTEQRVPLRELLAEVWIDELREVPA